MKQLIEKYKGVVNGRPGGFLVSLAFHGAVFLLAGTWVVIQHVIPETPPPFKPVVVKRPDIKFPRPPVKVPKNPPKPSRNMISIKRQDRTVEQFVVPEFDTISDNMTAQLSLFNDVMDWGPIDPRIGDPTSIGNDFVGTFYDLKRSRSGSPIPMDPETYANIMKDFVRYGWNTAKLSKFYRSPRTLYATTFAVPPVLSSIAPEAFGEGDTLGYCWVAHYKGQLVHHEDIRFRFWGQGDDVLAVRVDGKVVLIANWQNGIADQMMSSIWSSTSADSRKYPLGNNQSVIGDWIELKAGEPKEMEVILGEAPGGVFCSMLCVEVDGVEYPENPYRHGPKLPIFKTEEPSLDLVEAIHRDLDPGDASVTDGPVFRDFSVAVSKTAPQESSATDNENTARFFEESGMRPWRRVDGEALEAELITVMGDKAVLKNRNGKQVKIPISFLCDADRNFIDLSNPPVFELDFSNTSSQRPLPEQSPYINADQRPLRIFDYTFGAKIRQKTAREYNHELTVEFFAVGDEVDGCNHVLLDRQVSTFVPSETNGRAHRFSGQPVKVQTQSISHTAPIRGTKYGGFLITVTDKRGKIIQYKASHDFLFENLENLKKVPVGKHFNKEGNRVGPPRPTQAERPDWV